MIIYGTQKARDAKRKERKRIEQKAEAERLKRTAAIEKRMQVRHKEAERQALAYQRQADREQKERERKEEQTRKAEQNFSLALQDIERLEPLRTSKIKQIEQLKFDKNAATANGHYIDTARDFDKKIEKAESQLYTIEKKLQIAYFNLENAERRLTA